MAPKPATMDAENLEYWVRHILNLIKENRGIAPFSYFVVESRLVEREVEAIYDLMEEVKTALARTGRAMNHDEFEKQISMIVPSKRGDYAFAEGVISTLNGEHRYSEVYKWMKKDGMNI
jgi:hypothetical protein